MIGTAFVRVAVVHEGIVAVFAALCFAACSPGERSSEQGAMGREVSAGNEQVPSAPTPVSTASPDGAKAGEVRSGITGTIRSVLIAGVPGAPAEERPASLEFSIAPADESGPRYDDAIVVRSDANGRFRVALPPGRYWIGPRAKALDPSHYDPRAAEFSETTVEVEPEGFIDVELTYTQFAP